MALSVSSNLDRAITLSSPLPRLIGLLLRRAPKGRTPQEKLELSPNKEEYRELIKEVLAEAQKDFPKLRKKLASVGKRILMDIDRAKELPMAKAAIDWRLRQMEEGGGKPLRPQIAAYLRQKMRI